MNRKAPTITLDQVKTGQSIRINKILDSTVRCLSTRFGVGEGQVLKCIHKTNNGPVILQKRFQEIALGQSFTQKIEIQVV